MSARREGVGHGKGSAPPSCHLPVVTGGDWGKESLERELGVLASGQEEGAPGGSGGRKGSVLGAPHLGAEQRNPSKQALSSLSLFPGPNMKRTGGE